MDTLTVEFLRPVFRATVLVGVVATLAVRCLQFGAQLAIYSSAGGRRSQGTQSWRAHRTIAPFSRDVLTHALDEGEHRSHSLEEMALMKKPRADNSPIHRLL